uniref:Uncharacterized protein n=1 Tax=Solanum tuberosum TaxID=4113 RepID=M1A8S5_SOLTU
MKKHPEQNTKGVEASREEIESNKNAIVSFISQFGGEELRVILGHYGLKDAYNS